MGWVSSVPAYFRSCAEGFRETTTPRVSAAQAAAATFEWLSWLSQEKGCLSICEWGGQRGKAVGLQKYMPGI